MVHSNLNDLKRVVTDEKINFFVCSSSFEDRCFSSVLNMPPNKNISSLICYNSNEEQSIIENANHIHEILGEYSTLLELSSDQPVKNLLSLVRCISSKLVEISKSSEVNVLLDTTTFTHETLLIILKIFELEKEKIDKLFVVYVGATDYSFNSVKDEDKWLSKGIKEIRTVLGYSGSYDPVKKNHLMILFGFESERTKMLIENFEFNSVTLGFATKDKSIQNNHQEINYKRHSAMLDLFLGAEMFEFSLINPTETKEQVLSVVKKYGDYNIVIAPMNNKLSTIGVGLAALDNTDIQVTYAKPNLYNYEAYSKARDDFYCFELSL